MCFGWLLSKWTSDIIFTWIICRDENSDIVALRQMTNLKDVTYLVDNHWLVEYVGVSTMKLIAFSLFQMELH